MQRKPQGGAGLCQFPAPEAGAGGHEEGVLLTTRVAQGPTDFGLAPSQGAHAVAKAP